MVICSKDLYDMHSYLGQLGCGFIAEGAVDVYEYTSRLMTIQLCIEICRGKKLSVSGLQFDKCICLPDLSHIQRVPQAFCTGPCVLNEFQSCGSEEDFEYFSLFRVVDFFGPLGGIQGCKHDLSLQRKFATAFFSCRGLWNGFEF